MFLSSVREPRPLSPSPCARPVPWPGFKLDMGDGSNLSLFGDMDGDDAKSATEPSADPPVPALKKRKTTTKSVHKKGTMYCIGCDEYLPVSEFGPGGHNFHSACKAHLDRIYNQCKRQGQVQWFYIQKHDPKKCRAMLDHYIHLTQEAGGEGKKKISFNVAQFQEIIATEQLTSFVGKGVMMWEGQAIDFWKSPAGGCMSADAAEARWKDMSTHYKARTNKNTSSEVGR